MALLLAGIPLRATGKEQKTIVKICRELEYNIHESYVYDNIMDDLIRIPGAERMMEINSKSYKLITEGIYDKKPKLYVDEEVVKRMFKPSFCIDIMNKFGEYTNNYSGTGKRILPILNSYVERQNIEILISKKIPFRIIAESMNSIPGIGKKFCIEDVVVYYEYFFRWGRDGDDDTFGNLVNYINIDNKNEYYRRHRRMLRMTVDEILASIGYFSDDARMYINKKMFGVTSTEILDSLRNGKHISEIKVKLYMHADASIAEEKRSTGNEDVRERMLAVFSNMEVVANKRMVAGELIHDEVSANDEPDEPAVLKR
ncbi:MAG: hypothetical protein Q8M92_02280 [Candidatus Subteraquimicrobiales bacterium]|nr:hypothetical protein [Candidatus Subteraquimicrobiales bacterium]